MHRCLLLPEILLLICSEIDAWASHTPDVMIQTNRYFTRNRASLLRVALTCKSFLEPRSRSALVDADQFGTLAEMFAG